ncbi:hypothetical protein C8A00DRAFT_17213 [Chaetomidium leptoderma]|uniref:Uncharacterized protein n=1 Tax=Chaetomidium leptoderma TaxID=669021 RepID=A0AAN6ZTJ2_9PEZI|nr:hypothetical protein C8A00DRAFT_17213 [Chaetomidium leptoderma]
MVGLYDDPFAYDGSEFPVYLAQDRQFASGSSPEDFHVTSATEPHFPAAIHHSLKGQGHHGHHQQHHQQPYHLSPTDPLGPNLDNAYQTAAAAAHHLPRSAPTSVRVSGTAPNNNNNNNPTINTMGLTWNTTTATTNPSEGGGIDTTTGTTTDQQQLRNLLAALQSDLRQSAQERDEARMQLSTARNELYAARQVEKRLRVERDEARSQAEFLGAERVKLRQTETRLRRERNEARMAAARGLKKGGGGGRMGRDNNKRGESLGGDEESGESPETLMGVGMEA